MSLYWTIDSRLQLFAITCDGNVSFDDANAMVDAIVGANGFHFRKLFDGLRGSTNMTDQEVLRIGVRLRGLHAGRGPHGPLAVVFAEDKYEQIARVLGVLAAASRPMRVFKERHKARKWLDSYQARVDLPLPETVGA